MYAEEQLVPLRETAGELAQLKAGLRRLGGVDEAEDDDEEMTDDVGPVQKANAKSANGKKATEATAKKSTAAAAKPKQVSKPAARPSTTGKSQKTQPATTQPKPTKAKAGTNAKVRAAARKLSPQAQQPTLPNLPSTEQISDEEEEEEEEKERTAAAAADDDDDDDGEESSLLSEAPEESFIEGRKALQQTQQALRKRPQGNGGRVGGAAKGKLPHKDSLELSSRARRPPKRQKVDGGRTLVRDGEERVGPDDK